MKLWLILLLLLSLSVALAVFAFKYFSDKNTIEVELIPEHPGFTSMRLLDQKAWDELFERTNFSDLKTITQGKTTLKLEKPIKKVVLIITDEEQKNFVLADNAIVGSSANVTVKNKTLEVKMYINEDLVDSQLINYFVHDTFWLISKNNVPADTDIKYLILESKKYLQKNKLWLIRLK